MSAIIDLHGLPGSQNGFGHSGIKLDPDEITWQTEENLDLSITVLKTIARKYANGDWSDVVRGIELVNEPITWGANSFNVTRDWVVRAYNAVAETAANKALYIMAHDSFMDPWDWYEVLDEINRGPNAGRFVLDTHAYQNKGRDMSLTQDQRIVLANKLRTPFLDAQQNGLSMIVGEWTLASSFCMAGETQFPGHTCNAATCNCTGNPNPQWCGDYDAAMFYQVERYGAIQRKLWEAYTHGWFLWTAKAQGAWGLNTSMSEECHLMTAPLSDGL
jgi:glucan 1,3-beta-glucosidase